MSATNRSKLIAKLHAALKKKYSVPPASPSRPLLEHALYACLLEDCPSELADEGLAKLEQDYFDWNEVRVTTVTELSIVLSSLPDPNKAASRLKSTLQGIFEEFYSFDLDHLKKENLGKAVAKFENLSGMTPFVLSYIIQHGLGGHSIPIDYSAMVIMLVTGIASQGEASDGRVPGLERAIPKSKGAEFATLIHQPAVALTMDAKDKDARTLIESVVKGSSAGLDEWLVSKKAAKKRVAKRKAEEREVAKQEAEAEAEATAASVATTPVGKKKPIRSAAKATSTTNKPKPAKKAPKSTTPVAKPSATATKPSVSAAKPSAPAAKPSAPAAKAGDPAPEPSDPAATDTDSPIAEKDKKSAKKTTANKSTKNTEAKAEDLKVADKTEPKKSAKKSDTIKSKTDDAETTASDESGESSGGTKKTSNRKLTQRKPR